PKQSGNGGCMRGGCGSAEENREGWNRCRHSISRSDVGLLKQASTPRPKITRCDCGSIRIEKNVPWTIGAEAFEGICGSSCEWLDWRAHPRSSYGKCILSA